MVTLNGLGRRPAMRNPKPQNEPDTVWVMEAKGAFEQDDQIQVHDVRDDGHRLSEVEFSILRVSDKTTGLRMNGRAQRVSSASQI